MKLIRWAAIYLLVVLTNPVQGATSTTQISLDELIQQVRLEAKQEAQHNSSREQRFLRERDKQKLRLHELSTQLQDAQTQSQRLQQQYETNQQQLQTLQAKIDAQAGDLNALFAVAKQNAMELAPLINESIINAEFPDRNQILITIAEKQEQTLSMQELKHLWLLLLDEMNENGKITQFNTQIISPNGESIDSKVTRSGVFTATTQGMFLRYVPQTTKLVQLARQPASSYQKIAENFETTHLSQQTMIIDPSKGNILTVLLQTPELFERIEQGGFIAYLILFFGALGLLIILFRYLAMLLASIRINRQLKLNQAHDNNPMGRLMTLLSQLSQAKPETISLHLDEAVNNEAAKLHFGLKTLAVFAAITPLLGLLGTVTGMIETFQSISLFGSGDPKLMSGGISQALITTQLGLAVAIPILLMHTLLQGKANRLVEILDAQSSLLFEKYLNQSLSNRLPNEKQNG